jgi:hypothetical protein
VEGWRFAPNGGFGMTNYVTCLAILYPTAQYSISGNDYSTLSWESDSPKPSQEELDAAWPQVQYEQQVAAVETARLIAYEQQSDPLFFKWQRGDATELEWREAVAKVKAENPYPPAP